MGPRGFEPPTYWLRANRSDQLSYEPVFIGKNQVLFKYLSKREAKEIMLLLDSVLHKPCILSNRHDLF